jgi:hypothetical protein
MNISPLITSELSNRNCPEGASARYVRVDKGWTSRNIIAGRWLHDQQQ